MASKRKIIEDRICPFCDKYVHYWPNCSRTTNPDYDNYAYSQSKRGTKQFFHLNCFYQNTRGAMSKKGN